MTPLARYQLEIIAGKTVAGFFELRYKPFREPMRQQFIPLANREYLHNRVLELAEHSDVFIACAPRTKRSGRLDAVSDVNCLWVDCDRPEAAASLRSLPQPTLTVASGHGLHAYWALSAPVSPADAARGNRRLAAHIGADKAATDATRVLRPIGGVNWKDPLAPIPVRAVDCDSVYHDPVELAGSLPDPEPPRAKPEVTVAWEDAGATPLEEIPANVYIPALSGREVNREGYAQCPWHKGGNENHPSLRAHGISWCCYGQCEPVKGSGQRHLGGRIYHFAALMAGYQLPLRGDDYLNVKRELEVMFLDPEWRTT